MVCFRVMMVCFFNDTATTEIYTLSLHDALPISPPRRGLSSRPDCQARSCLPARFFLRQDRKSTRLNSRHMSNSYAVFFLKKCRNKRKFNEDNWHNFIFINVLIIYNLYDPITFLLDLLCSFLMHLFNHVLNV